MFMHYCSNLILSIHTSQYDGSLQIISQGADINCFQLVRFEVKVNCSEVIFTSLTSDLRSKHKFFQNQLLVAISKKDEVAVIL